MAERKFTALLFGAIILSCFPLHCFSQQKQGANWLFGGRIHLNFNEPKPTISNYAFADTTATSVATISDKNGNLLFFSSGGRLATRQQVNGVYLEMPNGNLPSIIPDQPPTVEMIVQSVADSNIYYLFFTAMNAPGSFYSPRLYKVTIDMRLNNGFGDVVTGSLQLLRKGMDDMKLSAAVHTNNRDTWILTQNYANDSLIAYLLTPNGLLPPVKTKINQPLGFFSLLKTSPNSEMFAIRGETSVELFDFNRTTGMANHRYSLAAPDPNYYHYSFAFSPDNSKVYTGTTSYSVFPNNATVFQFDLSAGSPALVNASRNVIFNTTTYAAVGDMQLAMDGKIYITFIYPINSQYLSQINCPNLYGPAAGFKFNGIDLQKPVTSGTLPALNQTVFRNAGTLQAQAYKSTICLGDTVQLSAFGAGAEQFKWEPANGLSSSSETLPDPFVSPIVTTTYKVTGSSACNSSTAFVMVTVLPKVLGVSVAGPLQVSSLTEQEYVVQNPNPGSIFNWQVTGGTIQNGQGQGRISVNWGAAGEGTVSVTEIPQTGCIGEKVSLKVQLTKGPAPKIYNVFTPDNDGRNDAFVIENLKWYPENELRIYNRWGQEVFKTNNYKNTWKAEKLSAGTYYYLFSSNGQSWKGWVEVIK